MTVHISGLSRWQMLPWWSSLSRVAAKPVVWCALATALLFVLLPGVDKVSLTNWLGDTDDAVRLVTVRELIAGHSWFDLTLSRIGAPEPLVSHWSRLIDAPLAALIMLFTPILGPEGAELATRMLWPAMLFFVLMSVVSQEASRRAGPWAAGFAIVLTMMSVMPLVQFKPGRVDHHNAQILCAVGGLLFLVRSLESNRAGWIAGGLIGIGLAVGYEAIGLVVPALALAAAVALWEDRGIGGVTRAATATTAALLVVLLATIPPSRWFEIHCDALSLNLPVLAGCCALGLWGALRMPARYGLPGRLGSAALGATAGTALYGLMEPACLMGPFGQVNPALSPIWLDHVMESQNILHFGDGHWAPMLAFVAFIIAGIAAQFTVWRAEPSSSNALAVAILVLAALLGCWQIKLMLYASWVAILPLAVFVARLDKIGSLTQPLVGIGAVMLLNQGTLGTALEAGELAVRTALSVPVVEAGEPDVGKECARTTNVARLGELPTGLIAANIDLGPHIVATTAHRVVAAPYHRLDKGILANHAIFYGAPPEAERTVRSLGVDYIALCGSVKSAGAPRQEKYPGSLRSRLLRGDPVAFLEEIAPRPGKPIRVWRVLRAR